MSVVRRAHDSEVDEFGADIGIDDTNDEGWDNNETEGTLSVDSGAKTAEGGSGGVLA